MTEARDIRPADVDVVGVIEHGTLNLVDGVVTATVASNSNKRDALKRMDDAGQAELPVVDEAGRFLGMIERDKLTSSIVLDLVGKL